MVDIDGHCYVDMEDENDIDRLKQFLIERFPRITGFKEVDRIDFYNIICSNEGWQEKIKNE